MNRFVKSAAVAVAAAVTTAFAARPARASLVNLGAGSFNSNGSVITFSEQPIGTINPVYNLNVTGIGAEQVSFAGTFTGQTTTGSGVVTLGTVKPTGPLSLNTANKVSIAVDSGTPTSPILSGTPLYNGPISVLFSQPVAAVGLSGGYFDAVGATTITAFDASGTNLGSITNSKLGIEFYGLADSTGASDIAGISFYITGNEPAGFAIDNLTFGAANSVVPEPASLSVAAVAGAGLLSRRRRGTARRA